VRPWVARLPRANLSRADLTSATLTYMTGDADYFVAKWCKALWADDVIMNDDCPSS